MKTKKREKIRKKKSAAPMGRTTGGWRMTMRTQKRKRGMVQSTLDLFAT